MAKKTNCTINGIDYYRIRKVIGRDKNGDPIEKAFYGNCKSDAERKYENWLKDEMRGIRAKDNISLVMAMNQWLWEIVFPTVKKHSTFERYEGIFRNYIENSPIAHLYLKNIEKIDIQGYFTELHRDDKTYSQIYNLFKLLRKFFIYCQNERILPYNPVKGIELDAYKDEFEDKSLFDLEDEGGIEIFTDSETDIINKELTPPRLRILANFALGTGLREGELLALTNKDIRDTRVQVTKSVRLTKVFTGPDSDEYEYKRVVDYPKTSSSRRIVSFPAYLLKDLREMSRIKKEDRLKLGQAYNDNDLIFPTPLGNYIDAKNLLRAWTKALGELNIPYRKFHALRHTYATQSLERGVDIFVVSRSLGHSTIKTTEKYLHLTKKFREESVAPLNDLL